MRATAQRAAPTGRAVCLRRAPVGRERHHELGNTAVGHRADALRHGVIQVLGQPMPDEVPHAHRALRYAAGGFPLATAYM
jgi:hypothetical protein